MDTNTPSSHNQPGTEPNAENAGSNGLPNAAATPTAAPIAEPTAAKAKDPQGVAWPKDDKPKDTQGKSPQPRAGRHLLRPKRPAQAQPCPAGGATGPTSNASGCAGNAASASATMGCPLLAAGVVLPKPSWRKRHPFLFWGGIVLLVVLFANAGKLQDYTARMQGPMLGVVNIEGVILSSDATVNWVDTLVKDKNVHGILVRVNSPGGAVGPSQEMYAALKRAAIQKPVVVSMGAMAASGGYYLALAGHEIFASPSTLTASIGVIMEVPNFEGLMGMLGISNKTLATGALKGAGSTTRAMTEEEEAYFRQLIGDMHEQFIATVAENRRIPLEQVRTLADGRAMTGRQAHAYKLVDTLGDMTEARNRLRELSGLPAIGELRLLEGPPKKERWLDDMVGSVLRIGMEQQTELEQPRFWYR